MTERELIEEAIKLLNRTLGRLDARDDLRQQQPKFPDSMVRHEPENIYKGLHVNKIVPGEKLFVELGETDKGIENRANLRPDEGVEQMPYLKQGTIRQRKIKGALYWEARYWWNGKQYSIYDRVQKECVKKLIAALELKKKGLTAQTQKPEEKKKYTLKSWLTEWYEVYKAAPSAGLSQSWLGVIRSNINNHIVPAIKDPEKDIRKVTGLELQEIINSAGTNNKRNVEYSYSRTRKAVFNTLNESMAMAKKLQIIKNNPMDAVMPVKHNYIEGVPLSEEEQQKFLSDSANEEYRFYYLLLLCCGARPGEGIKAQWKDFDWEKNTVQIHGTKTKASKRVIPFFEPLKEVVKQIPKTASDKLFQFTYRVAEDRFIQICKGHTLKDLRHTFATRSMEAGVPIKVVMTWLGHTKITTTANTYTHVLDPESIRESKKITSGFYPYFYPQNYPKIIRDDDRKGKDGS